MRLPAQSDLPSSSTPQEPRQERSQTGTSFWADLQDIALHGDALSAKKLEEYFSVDTSLREPGILAVYRDLFRTTWQTAPDIRIARARLRQKSREQYTAWARRIAPAIRASLSQVHRLGSDDTSLSATPAGGDQTDPATVPSSPLHRDGTDYPDWRFSLDLPIYRRPVSLKVDLADVGAEIAANNLAIVTRELDLRLRTLLNSYLTASYRFCNIRNSVNLSREHVHNIQRGYELRDQTRLQLLRAQANLNELEARYDLDEQRRDATLRDLLDFTGLRGDEPLFARLHRLMAEEIRIAGCINSLADIDRGYERIRRFVETMDSQGLRNYFQENSLLYRKILLERRLADTTAETYTQDEWPELALRGYYARKEDTRFEEGEGEGSLALVLSVPLFSGGTIFSTRVSRDMAQRVARVTHVTDQEKMVHTIENNRQLIRSLRKVYTTQQVHLRQQQEIVILSLKSYAIKQTSMQDLLTSKNRLIDAKDALMETTGRLGVLFREFAWQLGCPYPGPEVPTTDPDNL